MTVLTAAFRAALVGRQPLAVLAESDHPSGYLRMWTGLGPLSFEGATWTGVGLIAQVEAGAKSTNLAIQEVRLSLSGLPADAAAVLPDQVRGRTVKCRLAAFDEAGRVVADPILLFEGTMEAQVMTIAADLTATVGVVAQVGFWTLERAVNVSWSNEEQQAAWPGDTGFDRVPDLVDKEVAWTIT